MFYLLMREGFDRVYLFGQVHGQNEVQTIEFTYTGRWILSASLSWMFKLAVIRTLNCSDSSPTIVY